MPKGAPAPKICARPRGVPIKAQNTAAGESAWIQKSRMRPALIGATRFLSFLSIEPLSTLPFLEVLLSSPFRQIHQSQIDKLRVYFGRSYFYHAYYLHLLMIPVPFYP